MRHHFKWDKKYLHWGMTAFCVITCAILFYMALSYLPAIGRVIGAFVKILSPFVWGLVITWLLAPFMKLTEKRVFTPFTRWLFKKNGRNDGKKLARALAVLLSEILLLTVISVLLYLILPQLYQSLETIVLNSSSYIETASKWVSDLLENVPEVKYYVMNALDSFSDGLVDWIKTSVLPGLGSFAANITVALSGVFTAIYNLLIGIVVSVYLLGNLEGFLAAVRRVMYSIFTIEAADKIREGASFVDKTFIGFINGKLLDSAIIGLICYIFCAIVNIPYALLVSVIVGVTNVIPFFGPFIGAIPSALIIVLVNPIKCLVFLIFIILLQQLDGNFIGPKILGSSIGISGFWVMFSIILGAGLFGFWGMLLGVPVFVVIHTVVDRRIRRKLKRSDLPEETASYIDLDHIDPVTRELVKKTKEETQV